MPAVVTANDLMSGRVVYLDALGGRSSTLANAAVAADADAREHLVALAGTAAARCIVTGVYAFNVRLVDGRPEPLSVRERIRAAHAVAA